jgi:hypothetical protein
VVVPVKFFLFGKTRLRPIRSSYHLYNGS